MQQRLTQQMQSRRSNPSATGANAVNHLPAEPTPPKQTQIMDLVWKQTQSEPNAKETTDFECKSNGKQMLRTQMLQEEKAASNR